MTSASLLRLLLLAAIWGGSYALLRIVAPVLGGIGTMWTRIAVGGVAMLLIAWVLSRDLEWRRWMGRYLMVGLFNTALPFALISWAMARLPAGYGAILNACAPFFTVFFSQAILKERIAPAQWLGMGLGVAGIAAIVRLGPVDVTPDTLAAIAACIAATMSYGFINVYTKRHLNGAPAMGVAAGSLVLPALLLAPAGIAVLPPAWPSTTVAGSVLVLGVVCSALAYVLYFRLIADAGPTRAVSVTFLVPVFGALWGALFLGEAVTASVVAGGALVLVGVGLVLGVVRLPTKPQD
ncbi:MAG: EamA family transporter [Betaproteobacteria bacterium]|nr:EamA family transporter [Betaproteobacteria bacterium]